MIDHTINLKYPVSGESRNFMQKVKVPTKDGFLFTEYKGYGKPIIFVHGEAADLRSWNEQEKYLSRVYETITYDQRGYGKSSIPVESSEFTHEEDLDELISFSDITKSVLVGHSVGALIATNYAILFPEKVELLVLISPFFDNLKTDSVFIDLFLSIVQLAKEGHLLTAKRLWIESPLFDVIRGKKDGYNLITEMVKESSCHRWIRKNRTKKHFDSTIEHLKSINIPVLLISGEKDVDYIQQVTKTAQENISISRKVVISNAGHCPHLEFPMMVNREIETFLNDNGYYGLQH